MYRFAMTAALLCFSWTASAQVAPECKEFAGPPPADYDEQTQQDFMANYVALATTFSPIHGPIPHEPGHGALGLQLGIIPPLGCEKRFALQHTKTEDTNKTPIVPRPTATFAFPNIGIVHPYVGFAYVPPVKVFGTTNVILSGEFGVGFPVGDLLQLGARFHATSQKTVGEFVTPFTDDEPAVDDLFVGSTFGLDLMAGLDLDIVVPYLAFGLTDASTIVFIGDDGLLVNNYHPYFGPVFSAGVDGLVAERFRFGGEFYGAMGGYSLPDVDAPSVTPAARYGHIYTARFKVAVEL